MGLKQTPLIFVSLLLEEGQFNKFEAAMRQAADVLINTYGAGCDVVTSKDAIVLLDRDSVRIGLSYSDATRGEILTFAVGPRLDVHFSPAVTDVTAEMLRHLVKWAESELAVREIVWQAALLPLEHATMQQQADWLELYDPESGTKPDSSFIVFVPGHALCEPTSGTPEEQDEAPSFAMQASALALSSTFAIVTPPLGVAMLTYAALRQSAYMDLLPKSLKPGS